MLYRFDHSIELATWKRTPRNNLNKKAGLLFTLHRSYETLEVLGGMLHSFDDPEQSSTEQGRANGSKVIRCSVKCWI